MFRYFREHKTNNRLRGYTARKRLGGDTSNNVRLSQSTSPFDAIPAPDGFHRIDALQQLSQATVDCLNDLAPLLPFDCGKVPSAVLPCPP